MSKIEFQAADTKQGPSKRIEDKKLALSGNVYINKTIQWVQKHQSLPQSDCAIIFLLSTHTSEEVVSVLS